MIAGRKYWADATPVAGQQFEYAFDDIGNRKSSRNGGDQTGDNLRETSYTANRLNQYSSRTTPSSADVIGMARGNAVTVKLNGSSVGAPYRKGEYFWKDVTVRPGASPATGTISFDVDGTAFSGGTVTLPAQVEQTAAPANLAYDADGNLTLDSLWSYQWDAENRLVAMLRVDGTKRVEMGFFRDCLGIFRWRWCVATVNRR